MVIDPADQGAEPVIVRGDRVAEMESGPADLEAEKVIAPVVLVAETDLEGQEVKMETVPVVREVVVIAQGALVARMVTVPEDLAAEIVQAVQAKGIDQEDPVMEIVPADLGMEIGPADLGNAPGVQANGLTDRVAAIGLITVRTIDPIGTSGTVGGTIIGLPSTIIGTITGTITGTASIIGSVRTGGLATIGAGTMLPAPTGGVGRLGQR